MKRDIIVLTNNDLLVMPEYIKGTINKVGNRIAMIAVVPMYAQGYSLSTLNKYLPSFGWGFVFSVGWRSILRKLSAGIGIFSDIARISKNFTIPCIDVANINSPSFIKEIRKMHPKILLLLSCPQIIKAALLKVVDGKILNVHSSMLPKYRGLYAPFWAMLNKEDHAGVTVHLIENEKIDAGGIICQCAIPIYTDDTFYSLAKRIANIGPDVIADAVKLIDDKNFKPIPNNIKEGCYKSWPKKEDIVGFRRIGWRFF